MAHRPLSDQELESLLASLRIVRVAFFSREERYVVPLGFTWFRSALWGTTTRGRKTVLAESDNRVALVIDSGVPFVSASITGEGRFGLVTLGDVADVLPMMQARFPDNPEWSVREFQAGLASGSSVFWRISVTGLSGRQFHSP